MNNRSIEEAQRYHEAAKSRSREEELHERRSAHSNRYAGCPISRLNPDAPIPAVATLAALANTEFDEEIPLDMARLSQVLRPAAHELAHRPEPSRDAPAVGIHLVSSDIAGVRGGVYHLNPRAFELERLREGDHRPDLVAAAGDNQSLAAAPAALVLSARLAGSYRSILAGTGRILALLLVAASAAELAASAEMTFVDGPANRLLGLDGTSEAALCLIPLGRSLNWAQHMEREPPALNLGANGDDLAASLEPERRMHRASSLLSNEETRPLRGPCARPLPEGPDDMRLDAAVPVSRPLRELFQKGRGGSDATVNPAGIKNLSALLHTAMLDLPADFLEGPETSLIDRYLAVHRVDGLGSGLYRLNPATLGLTRLRTGSLEAELEHALASHPESRTAAAHMMLTCDFEPVLQRYGNRGYRMALVEAGAVAERIRLAAESMGLGATLLRFSDDEMIRFLSPAADGKAALLTLGLG